MIEPSMLLRRDVIEALRRGTVPRRGLDLFAVGTDRYAGSLREELERCATGGAVFKALRGDFGCGKSFTARWYQQQALALGVAWIAYFWFDASFALEDMGQAFRHQMSGSHFGKISVAVD